MTLAAAALRLAGLGAESYWFDEIWAVKQSRVAFGDVIASLKAEDVHPPLWPALLHLWIRLFGEGEAAVRLLPALLGTAAVPLFGAAMSRLQGARAGLLAAALLAVHPYAVEFSQEARSYALLLVLSTAALWLTVAWRQAGHRLVGAAWALVAGLLLYTHVFGALVDLALGVALLWPGAAADRRPPVGHVVAAGAFAIATYLPWVPVQLQQIGRVQEGFWIAPLTWTDPVRWLWHWSGYSSALLVLTVPALVVGLRAAAPPFRRVALLLTLALVVLPGAASLVVEPFFQPKYAIAMVIVLVGAAAVALAGPLGAAWPRWRRGLAAAVLVGLAGFSAVSVHAVTAKEQYRELGALGRADRAAGATVVTEARMAPYVGYYLDAPLGDAAHVCLAAVRPGRVTLLLAHPVASSVGEDAIAGCCHRLEDVPLVLARAVRFACP